MILSIAESIETTRQEIATFTGVNVTLGMPDNPEQGLYLFPYLFSLDTSSRSLPTNLPSRDEVSSIDQPYYVKCLLIPNSPIDYTALSKGYDFINSNPLLETNKGIFKFVFDNIATEELTRLFMSTGVTYRLTIPFIIYTPIGDL